MLHQIKHFLYFLLVKSRLVYHCLVLFKPFVKSSWRRKENTNYVTVDESGCKMNLTQWKGKLYPSVGQFKISRIKDVHIRHDDVIICGYPKTGCHWTFEILRMLQYRTTSVSKHGKLFEGMIELLPEFVLDSLPSPRILNTHVLYDDLPVEMKTRKNKIVLTTRCPKDVEVSLYHHHKTLKFLYDYNGSFKDHFKLFMDGSMDYGCYFDFTSNWKRVMISHPSNPIFPLQYEHLKNDPVSTIRNLARFLDIDVTDKFIQEVAAATDFNNLKAARSNDPVAFNLYRKGIVGDWTNWLTEAQSQEVDARWKLVMARRQDDNQFMARRQDDNN